jgi:hypothetical protein
MATRRKFYAAVATNFSRQNTASSDHLKTSPTEPEPEKPTDEDAVSLINTVQQILTAEPAEDRFIFVMKIKDCRH